MSYSLLQQPWMHVRRQSGAFARVRPGEIVDSHDDDPVTAFAWGRPELDAAGREFMIGLLAIACAERVSDSDDWEEWFEHPPSVTALDEMLAPLENAFLLDGGDHGDGPRFMQDRQDLAGEVLPVEWLLIGNAVENTLERNADLFVKRWPSRGVLAAGTAAMALHALQTFAPSGGRGNLTSLRGGGPMTTLVLPKTGSSNEPGPSLWHQLWLNTSWGPPEGGWSPPLAKLDQILPWLVPTRSGTKTSALDVHPATCFWGMPRRIRLDLAPNEARQACAVTGIVEDFIVRGWRQRPNGNDYKGWPRAHPLTPYYASKTKGVTDWLAVHPQPGRQGFADWIGLVVPDAAATRLPADIVHVAAERLDSRGSREASLLVSGFDMDNMKARGFLESRMPLRLPPPGLQERCEAEIRKLVGSARLVATILGMALRRALFGDNRNAPSDGGSLTRARDQFWDLAEPVFHVRLADLFVTARRDHLEFDVSAQALRRQWLDDLSAIARKRFDMIADFDTIEETPMKRLIDARRFLMRALQGFDQLGTSLFKELDLPSSDKTNTGSRRHAR